MAEPQGNYLRDARDQLRKEQAPKTPEEAASVAKREFDTMFQDRIAQLGAEAPESKEPFSPADVMTLDAYASKCLAEKTGGEIEIPNLTPEDIDPASSRLPPTLYAKLRAIQELGKSGKAPKGFPVIDANDIASSSEGLREGAALLDSVHYDEKGTGPLSNEEKDQADLREEQDFERESDIADRKSPLSNEAVAENADSRRFMRDYSGARRESRDQGGSEDEQHEYGNKRALEQEKERAALKKKAKQ